MHLHSLTPLSPWTSCQWEHVLQAEMNGRVVMCEVDEYSWQVRPAISTHHLNSMHHLKPADLLAMLFPSPNSSPQWPVSPSVLAHAAAVVAGSRLAVSLSTSAQHHRGVAAAAARLRCS
jgi:hypothetical protein